MSRHVSVHISILRLGIDSNHSHSKFSITSIQALGPWFQSSINGPLMESIWSHSVTELFMMIFKLWIICCHRNRFTSPHSFHSCCCFLHHNNEFGNYSVIITTRLVHRDHFVLFSDVKLFTTRLNDVCVYNPLVSRAARSELQMILREPAHNE